MNLLRIEYFLAFCENMHFTNAARKLGISQPALTKAIYQLEADLGTRLVRREGKHTHLTLHGEVTHKKFRRMMTVVSAVERDLAETIHGSLEVLKFAVARSINFSRIAHFLGDFHRQRPKVKFEIIDCDTIECNNLLLNGRVDCVFTTECEAIKDRFICVELFEDTIGIASTTGKETNNLSVDHNELQFESSIDCPELTSQLFKKAGNDVFVVVTCTQQLWIQQMIKAGLGVGMAFQTDDMISGLKVSGETEGSDVHQVYAALPVGRNDSVAYDTFTHFLKQYNWHN